jgi:hypothetical protein
MFRSKRNSYRAEATTTSGFNIVGLLQIAAIVAAFGAVFAHGIVIGKYNIGFLPEYRFRQTLAVALSRLRQPSLHGYLAYQSVVDVLSENGLAIFPNEKGPHLDAAGWAKLLEDPVTTDRILRLARYTSVDPNLPPQLIRGNEIAYADYFYLAFRLFGLHMSSLYYFYFLLLGIACALFVIEFRRSPFLMFLLTTYLGGLFFLQSYAAVQGVQHGIQLATLANSRLFDALSLLPAVHVFVVVWKRLLSRLSTLVTTIAQSFLLAFIVDCRAAARWQIAMIAGTGAAFLLVGLWRQKPWLSFWRGRFQNGIWAACIAVACLAAHMSFINLFADSAYKSQSEYHLIWDSVLAGLLDSNAELQREYLGRHLGDNASPLEDEYIEEAINRDLTARNDRSSPIAVEQNNKIVIYIGSDPNEYNRLARALALRIISHHPIEVAKGLYQKILNQIGLYRQGNATSWASLSGMIACAVAGAILWLIGSIFTLTPREALTGAYAAIAILLFAAIPPLIEPSELSVGTLLSYLIAGVVAPATLIAVVATLALRAKSGARPSYPASNAAAKQPDSHRP